MQFRRMACAVLIVWSVCLAGATAFAAAPRPKVMNNFVSRLLRVRITDAAHSSYEFSNPRDGWVFVSIAFDEQAPVRVQVSLDSAAQDSAIIRTEGSPAESMRWLTAGKHRINVWKDGASSAELIVRTMPEIIFTNFVGEERSPTDAPCRVTTHPLPDRLHVYYWDFLRKNILKNVNVVTGGADASWMAKWISDGRKVIYQYPVLEKDSDKLYTFWSQFFKAPYEGVLVDEFIAPIGRKTDPSYNPGLNWDPAIMDVIKRIHDSPDLNGTFYAYMALPWQSKAEDYRMLLDTLISRGYKWVCELYLWEVPTEKAARRELDVALKSRLLQFRNAFPGSEKSCVVCLSILESWDRMPQVDFKVYLDMQLNMMANDPAFTGLYGVMAYQATRADPEIIRWLSQLYRHYCIEGKTRMLSKEYDYTYELRHIRNPDFGTGLKGWHRSAAEEGSIRAMKVAELPFKKGYLPRGDNVLCMKRSRKKPNVISQRIRNLEKGRLYSFRMFTGDIRDFETRQKVAVSVKLTGVEVIESESRQDIQHPDPNGRNKVCWNYHYRLFRATGAKAGLEISDWSSSNTPGGPVDQEIICDYVQIQPFFEEGSGKQ